MFEGLSLFIGEALLAVELLPLCTYGAVAFGPHARVCQCGGCARRRERAQRQHDQQFPPKPGAVLHTQEEWEAIWEEEEE